MSRLGNSFKNRFLRRALAIVLAGTMVMTGMPVSFAAETSDVKTMVETEVQGGTEETSEEVAEETEISQKESEETESKEPTEETTTEESNKETKLAATDDSETTTVVESEVPETEDTETDTEETETEQTTEEEENQEEYTSDNAKLNNHENAKWDVKGTIASKNGKLEGSSGTYTNGEKGDVLYINAESGKFAPSSDTIQIKVGTKIYIPVKTDKDGKAKITIYQSSISNTNDVFNTAKSTYLKLLKDEEPISSGVECTVSSAKVIEMIITLSDDTNKVVVICVEVGGSASNNSIYATKIVSGEDVRDDVYDDSVGASADFVMYNQEGYAKSYGDNGVTGGGVMIDAPENKYYTVNTADGFMEALKEIKAKQEPAVIRITENLNLGSKEFNISNYNRNLIRSDALDDDGNEIDGNIKRALMHPVLKRTGVSHLILDGFNDLTIFSTNGAAIKHCKITIKNSENIMIRNLVFDELWEWDDIVYVDSKGKTSTGQYDRNDWDYMTIDDSADGVWIDHCTFYKAYDGIIDVKKAKGKEEDQRVTVSWCKFEPKSAPKVVDGVTTYPFYDAQMKWLEANRDKTQYYRALTAEKNATINCKGEIEKVGTEVDTTLSGGGYSVKDVITYTCGQKKTHLLGQDDEDETAKGIRVTLANNSYKNSMDRMPRLRFGKAHVYNCVLDASELYKAHYVDEGGSKFDNHLVSNGALSTLKGYVYLENCYIDGIKNPLVSGNSKSDPGYIGANSHCVYMMNGENKSSELKPKNNNSDDYTGDKTLLEIKDISGFGLPSNYGNYGLYSDVSGLADYLKDKAGAGVVVMNPIRWTKTSYDGETDTATKDEKDTTNPAENDKTDYSIDDGGGEEGGDNPPTETDPGDETEKEDFSFNASDIEWIDLTLDKDGKEQRVLNSDYEKNGFTIKSTEGSVIVDKNTKSLNGTEYKQRIKLGGAGTQNNRSIHFKTKGAGTLTVYAMSSSSEETKGDRVLKLYKGSDSENSIGEKEIKAGTTLLELTYDIDSDSESSYWIGAVSGGVNIFYIAFAYKSEGGDNPPTPPTIQYPEESLILNANELPYITIETEQKINNHYTIIGANEAAVTIGKINEDGSSVTINEKDFTKEIQLGGSGDATKRTIKVTVPDAGKLIVYAQSSGSEDRTLVLKSEAETAEAIQETATASEPAVIEYPVSEAGVYYLYSSNSGINIFYVEYAEDTGNGDDEGDKTDTFYDASEGNSAELTKYNLEGFAASTNVTGGGLLKEGSKNYYVVTNEEEFIEALYSVRSLGREESGGLKPAAEVTPAVIEIKNDLNLGKDELLEQGIDFTDRTQHAKTVMDKNNTPLIHPTLLKTGVAKIKLLDFRNLTIYSKTGASIKHCGISFEGATSNIIIRNITFDELWEWDEKTSGDYDRNDWDYMTVGEQTDGIWIDHCTFYKAYDGIIDVRGDDKKQLDRQRVTISWCEFLPGSKDDIFFNEQMKWLEDNKGDTKYYKKLRDTEKMSEEDLWWYAYGQKKTHLFGADDTMDYASMIRVTMANNYYKNSMDRMPRLRYGKVHEYNCILDAQDLYNHKEGNSHLTSNGAISTCGGEVLLENCMIKGIQNPLLSGNGSSPTGYINAINSLYYMNGEETDLKVSKKGTGDLLITDEEAFKNAIPYKNYETYDASTLESTVIPCAGAGKLEMSTVQWEKVSYGKRTTDVTEDYMEGLYGGDTLDKPVANPGSETQATAVAIGTKIELKAEAADNIYYTTGTTPADTADPTDSQSDRKTYNAEDGIVITEAVTIKAVAQKGDKYSGVVTYTYTILSGETSPVATPVANWTTETQFSSTGGSIELTAEEGAAIYYLKDNKAITETPNATSELYSGPIAITEQTYIRAIAIKDGVASAVLDLHYTIASPGEVVKPAAKPASGAVAKGTKIELFTVEPVDNIYYRTDGLDPKADGRLIYDKNTGIIVNEEMTIRAVAEKDGKYSQDVSFTYTILSGGTPGNPDPPVGVKTISLDDCVITVPAAIYNKKTGNKQSTTYVTYQYTDANSDENHVRFVEGVDYKAEWKKEGNNYSVILTGSGRPEDGRDVDRFVIDEKSSKEISYKVYASAKDSNLINISKAKVDFTTAKKTALKNVYYTGYAYEIKVSDLDFSKDKSGLKDVPKENLRIACSNNINAGKATVTISVDPAYSDGKYAGVKTLNFTIKKAALNKTASKATAGVSFDKTASAAQQYIGSSVEAKDLQVTAKNGIKLRKNEDYTVTYKNSAKNGKVNVTVTVKGVGNNLSGTWSDTFSINQLDLGSQSVEINTKNNSIPYSPKGAKLRTITATKDGSTCTLKEGVDYTAKYEYDPAKKYNVGSKVTAVITGKGACKGTRRITNLEIVAADFASDEHIIVSGDVTVDKDAYSKNKTKAIENALIVTDASGVKLKAGKDYKIEEHSDTKTLIIQPISSNAQNYTGTKTVSYRIATNLAKDTGFVFDKTIEKNNPLVYDGRNPVKLTSADIDKYINKMTSDATNYDKRKYRLGGSNANIEIVPGTYKNNAKKGTAQVTVRGITGVDGGFYGQKVLKFKIVES